jgi:hypothetical protein
MSKSNCLCIRLNKKDCEWRDSGLVTSCIILGPDKPCIEEEKLMAEKELLKEKGIKEVEVISNMVKDLTNYLDVAPNMDVMDRVNDACGHLRKAKVLMQKFYGIE